MIIILMDRQCKNKWRMSAERWIPKKQPERETKNKKPWNRNEELF